MQPQIIAFSSGGYFTHGAKSRMDDYALRATGKETPRACLIAAASGDNADGVLRFMIAFGYPRAIPSFQPLFFRSPAGLADVLLEQDIIYIGGGNSANLLAVARAHGLVDVLRQAWQKGIVLAGESAGMVSFFEHAVVDSFGGLDPINTGMGLLKGSVCPHFNSTPLRSETFENALLAGMPAGYAVDDDAGLHFVGTELKTGIVTIPTATVTRRWCENGRVRGTPVSTVVV